MEFEKLIKLAVAESVQETIQQYMGRIPPELLTTEEAAKILKVDEQTIRRRCRAGDLKYVQVGKFIRIDLRNLNQYLIDNEM